MYTLYRRQKGPTFSRNASCSWFKTLTLKDVARVYDLLGVTFDSYNGEAFYEDKMPAVVQELKDKGLTKIDNGMTIVDLSEYDMPPCIILKSDGSTIYATRDIAAAEYRKNTYDFYKSLYVVAYQQSLHFRQILHLYSSLATGASSP